MPTIPATLAELTVPIDTVRPFGRNPRRGDVAAIRRSLEHHGQFRPLVVNRRTSEVLAGNHTLAAAKELGWPEVAVTFVDVDDDEALRIVLVDNRTADLGVYDDGLLAELLDGLPDLDGTAWQPRDLDRLVASLQRGREAPDTEPGPLPTRPRTKPGDLWRLGEHRLLCGDARDGGIERVVDGEPVEVLWTDPPYGVSYVGKTAKRMTITNDDAAVSTLLIDAFAAADAVMAPSARFYIAAPAGPAESAFRDAVARTGEWRLHQVLVWAKDVFVLGHSDYHYQHESILYGFKPGAGRPGRGRHSGSRWYGDNAASSVFAIPRPKRSTEHPTTKPVELIAAQLLNSSRRADVVLDPFAGSGSTLIACTNLERRCLAVEIDPAYCDVVVDRWERHTGATAER